MLILFSAGGAKPAPPPAHLLQQPPLEVHGRGPLPLTPFPHAPQLRSATGPAPPPGRDSLAPMQRQGSVPARLPAPAPAAAAAAAPMFPIGRATASPAPLRMLSPLGGPVLPLQPGGALQQTSTPMPRTRLFQGGPSASNTPAAASAAPMSTGGVKRGRSSADSGGGGVTPLMGSGITNLAGETE